MDIWVEEGCYGYIYCKFFFLESFQLIESWVYSRLRFQKPKKDSRTFMRLFFANNIYLKQI